MNLSTSILGSHACKQLQAGATDAVLTVGSDQLTRGELARVGCYNFTAARNLSALLRAVNARSLKDLFERVPPTALAVPKMGVISLAVLGAAFEARKVGGAAPLETWVRKHREKMVTFYTLKKHEEADAAQEKADQRRRQRAEQRVAQGGTTAHDRRR